MESGPTANSQTSAWTQWQEAKKYNAAIEGRFLRGEVRLVLQISFGGCRGLEEVAPHRRPRETGDLNRKYE